MKGLGDQSLVYEFRPAHPQLAEKIYDGSGGHQPRYKTSEPDRDLPGGVLVLRLAMVSPPPGFDICRASLLSRVDPCVLGNATFRHLRAMLEVSTYERSIILTQRILCPERLCLWNI